MDSKPPVLGSPSAGPAPYRQPNAPGQPPFTQSTAANDEIAPVTPAAHQVPTNEKPSDTMHAGASTLPAYAEQQAGPAKEMQSASIPATPLHMLRGSGPQIIDCPFCHRRAWTSVEKKGSSMQILAGAVLCLFCICLTCLPCIFGWLENLEYRCSSCGQVVAFQSYDSPIQVYGPQQNGAPAPAPPQRPQPAPEVSEPARTKSRA